jgi:hypothetical protein
MFDWSKDVNSSNIGLVKYLVVDKGADCPADGAQRFQPIKLSTGQNPTGQIIPAGQM